MNITRLLSQTYVRMLKEDAGMEDAAAHVHDEWMKRNPKADWNAAQHVPYEKLPDAEKEKDRVHIRTVGKLLTDTPKGKDESTADHHERIADAFGSIAHEEWRKGHEASKGEGAPRMKKVSDGTEVNINVPWRKLHPEWKRENLEAGRAAVAAHAKHMSGINESHTAKEIASTPSKELRGLADTYSKKVSVVRENARKAKEAGNHEEAAKLHKQADAHQDEEMDIRDELRKRTGMK
jgi:hypothetical protein